MYPPGSLLEPVREKAHEKRSLLLMVSLLLGAMVLCSLIVEREAAAQTLPAGPVAWGARGANFYGQTDVPAGLSNVKAISAGGHHSLALKEDGTVVAWGATNVPAGLANVKAVSAGANHSLALKEDGTVVAWGDNYYGQTDVPAGLNETEMISAGESHNLALNVPTAPGPVDFFNARAGDQNVSLSWSNPPDPDFTAVRILRSTTGPATSAVPGATQTQVYEGTGESFSDTNLTNGTTYYYTAYARDDAGLWSARATERVTPVDTTKPTVISTSPAAGATGVLAGSNVTANFSEAMIPSTINGTTFKLVTGGGKRTSIAATVTYNQLDKQAVLDPTSNLKPKTTYVATVTTGAKDLAGNPLASDQSWSFKTK